jgi:hypothetical protein
MKIPIHRTHILLFRIRLIMAALLIAALFSNAFAQEDSLADLSEYQVPEDAGEMLSYVNTHTRQKQSNKLWEAHAAWTKAIVLCLANENPSDYSIKRLLKHQEEIEDVMDSFYGDSFVKRLSELLYAHKTIAAKIKSTAQSGDSEANEEAYREWRLNKSEIIEFLREANSLYTVALSEARE